MFTQPSKSFTVFFFFFSSTLSPQQMLLSLSALAFFISSCPSFAHVSQLAGTLIPDSIFRRHFHLSGSTHTEIHTFYYLADKHSRSRNSTREDEIYENCEVIFS